MGRKSALSPEQWVEIERRHLVDGESVNSLAKAFGVDESTVRKKINPRNPEGAKSHKSLIPLALAKINAEKISKDISDQVADLPVSRQQTFNGLVAKLSNMSSSLASAGELGAATAHRLTAIANAKVQEIDDAAPLNDESMQALKGVAVLTKLANDSSQIGLNLLSANKEAIRDMNSGVNKEPGEFMKELVQFLPD